MATLAGQRARVHLLCSAPYDELGEPDGTVAADAVELLQRAITRLAGR